MRAEYIGIALTLATVAVRAETPAVTVEGGPDATGHTYSWTITNGLASPIVHVEFPHYRASLFFAPEGWTTSCTNLVGIGVNDPTGLCTATASSSAAGIATGRSATFNMQIGAGGAKRGLGSLTVRFGDGVTQTIANVPVSAAEAPGDRNLPLIGLGTVFLILIIARGVRRRRANRTD